MSFLIHEATMRLKKNHQWLMISDLINWSRIALLLGKMNRSGMGPCPYEPVMMVKALILGQWHSLSDPDLEEALRVRIDFMIFTGFEGEVPDETTLCRFRGRLIDLGLLEAVFIQVNKDLQQKGLKINPSKGAVVDATMISSAGRAQTQLEGIVVDREEPVSVECQHPRRSFDSEARWLKKRRKDLFWIQGICSDRQRTRVY